MDVTLFRILLGAVMLAAGRNLFWLFLGVVGFILGFDVAERLLHGPPGVIFVIALVAGAVSAIAAILIQKFAILVGGFITGGYLLPALLQEFGVSTGHYYPLFFIAGGIFGALLLKVFFNWALILLSSAVGSHLVVQSVHPGPQLRKVLFIILLLLGIAIQAGLTGRKIRTRQR